MKQCNPFRTRGLGRMPFLPHAFLVLALLLPAIAIGQSPSPVNLGTAANYVALAKTGISTTGTTQIVGNLGISPVAATYFTGFGQVLDPSGTFSTSPRVAGKLFAADYASPTPSQLTTAIGDMETAYTDAAGRTLPNYTDLHAGDLTGKTLTPGIYKWSTGVLVSPGGVTISGGPSDVWIFQIAQNVTISNGAQVTLTGGANPSRIFWQVAGQVTVGTSAAMKGIILCKTAIILNTGASFAGRALAQTAITLDGNAVSTGSPVDTSRPTVTSTNPANLATGVQLNKIITASFSEAMDVATINTTTFTLKNGSTPVTGTVSYTGTTATFTPDALLLPNIVYTGTITSAAKDVGGNTMASDFTWSFTTGASGDTSPPTVTSTSPAHLENGVALNKKIAATFSEAMDVSTINMTTFTLKNGSTPVTGTVSYTGTTATFTPSTNLLLGIVYTGTITSAVKDTAGNNMASDYTWTFTTGAAQDTIAPTVTSTSPAHLETGVALNKNIAATFSEAMDPLTINNVSFYLMQGTSQVPGTVSYVGRTATFTPSGTLATSTQYSATITTAVEDLAGQNMVNEYSWTFTTGPDSDNNAPYVTSTNPAHTETSVPLNKKITVTFNEPIDPLSITNASFYLQQGSTIIPATVSYVGLTATLTPATNLAPSTEYIPLVTTAIKDLAGIHIEHLYMWSFTTGASSETTPPVVTSTDPQNNAMNAPLNKKISATFSEEMDPLTMNNVTFTLQEGATQIQGSVTYVGSTATFTPLAPLQPFTEYRATVTTGVKDLAGNAMAAPYTWTFFTGENSDITAPTVTYTSPMNLETNVTYNKKIIAFFSKAMDPFTIHNGTFKLMDGTTNVQGTVSYVGNTATFMPYTALSPNTIYTATISNGVKDLAGNNMVDPYIWTFTTGSTMDVSSPMVMFTHPAHLETDVPFNQKITASFSELMDPRTINAITFSLRRGSADVMGTVSYTAYMATFSPYSELEANTTYTATITTGVTDLAGNHMASDYTWTFTTGEDGDTWPPFVIFTNPTNRETGVALNKKITATFNEPMDPSTISNMTFHLFKGTQQLYGVVTLTGTTATFATFGNLDASTEYTAKITTGVKDLAGNAMAFEFTWTFTTGADGDTTPPMVLFTSPVHLETGVALNKKITVTFNEPMDPFTISNLTFHLFQGMQPISGFVTHAGPTATFTPYENLDAGTEYTALITTGAKDLAGNAMASDYSWSFTTGSDGDTTPPRVIFTNPEHRETGVAPNIKITAVFNEPMDPFTINNMTFSLLQGMQPVQGFVTHTSTTASFAPYANLAANTAYTAIISTSVKDLAGNAMASEYTWTFTTGTEGNTSRPTVIFTDPVNLDTGVALNKKITAWFSEAMDPTSIHTASFTLKNGTTPVAGHVSYANRTAAFNPTVDLTLNTVYTATISTAVKDLAGNTMTTAYTWTFTTGTIGDTSPPTVAFTDPANLEIEVALSKNIAITFSEAMDPMTIHTSSFTLTHGITPVAGSVSYADRTATFNPTMDLTLNTEYTATISTAVKDLAGNAMTTTYTWRFTTTVTSGIETLPGRADGFALSQNYPNPFRSTTTILYQLANAERVTLTVYDLLGNAVATLVSADQDAGNYAVRFNAHESSIGLVPGVYFYRLEAGTYRATHTLTLYR